MACAVVLSFAVASTGPGHDGEEDGRSLGSGALPRDDDGTGPSAAGPARTTLPLGLATAVRCGPELTSPEGVEAQTCVLTQGAGTWARTSYRNATGGPLETVLSLMGPDGRGVRTSCAVGAEDAPGTCETPRVRMQGEPAGYTAVAEFAGRADHGPLLLRTGSNSPRKTAR